jgi:hydroxyacylglutathione hydrolase
VREGAEWRIGGHAVRVVETPGHSCDGVTYLVRADAGTTAFPGDLVFAGGRVLVSTLSDCSPHRLGESLRRLSQMSLSAVYPGHGPPTRDGAADLFGSAVAALDRRLLPPNLL